MSTGPQYLGAAQAAIDYLVNDLNWLIDDGGAVNCENDFLDGVTTPHDCDDTDFTDAGLSGDCDEDGVWQPTIAMMLTISLAHRGYSTASTALLVRPIAARVVC